MTDSEIRTGVITYFRETNAGDVAAWDLPGYGQPNFETALLQLQSRGIVRCYFNDDEMTDVRELLLVEVTEFGLNTVIRK
ncbi:MAG: hypothetical protein ACP59X_12955 [Solidesulfovibrio sp. DCME]|uniref:hypothetical protein n=1 Tax=Solidesulfovibrio sp. DCME TaxID=3447380 RepID=UPI003D096CEF